MMISSLSYLVFPQQQQYKKKNSKTDVHRLTIECTEKFLRVSNFHKSNDDSRILFF